MQLRFELMLNAEYGNDEDRKKCDSFKKIFSSNVGKYPHLFNFTKEEIKEVKNFITNHKTPTLLFYKILPDNNHLDEFSAYQIPVVGIDNLFSNKGVKLKKLQKAGIAKDYPSGTIIATKQFINIVEPLCKGLKWEPLNEDCFSLLEINKLQNSIEIINALEFRKNERPKSTFTISGDGRKVISKDDILNINANGFLISGQTEVEGKIYKTPERFIVSTALMKLLVKAKFQHIIKHLLPLLSADQVVELS